jgi:hypothetical protein
VTLGCRRSRQSNQFQKVLTLCHKIRHTDYMHPDVATNYTACRNIRHSLECRRHTDELHSTAICSLIILQRTTQIGLLMPTKMYVVSANDSLCCDVLYTCCYHAPPLNPLLRQSVLVICARHRTAISSFPVCQVLSVSICPSAHPELFLC